MASTYSPNLRIELIGSGEQANTWGNTTNTNLGTLIEQAICGLVSVDVTAGNVILTNLNGASDQSRQMILSITGTPGTTRTVTAPAVSKVYVVYNGSNDAISLLPSGGTGMSIPSGARMFVYTDGSAFYQTADTFGTVHITGGTIDGTTIGATTPSTGSFTTLTATGVITHNTTTNNQSYTTTGAGTITLTSGTTGSINNFNIGASTAGTGAFTTLSASSTFTLSGGTANGVLYLNGSKQATSGSALVFDGTNFSTTGSATATALIPTGSSVPTNGMYLPTTNTVAWSTATTEKLRLDASGNLGLGATPSAWSSSFKALEFAYATLSSSDAASFANNAYRGASGWVYKNNAYANLYQQNSSGYHTWSNAPSGTAGNPITFTQAMALDASGNLTLSGVGYTKLQVGATGDRPGTPAVGMIRYNSTTSQFEGYSGSSPAWNPVGGASISNDTSTATALYPLFSNATSGSATTLYTGNAKLLYTPSTGDLQSSQIIAGNGFLENSTSIATSYTVAASNNAGSFGPVSVASGVTVTVSSGSVWTVV